MEKGSENFYKQKLWIISELFPPEESATGYIMGEIARALSSKYDVNVICGPEFYEKRHKVRSSDLSDITFPVHRIDLKTFDKNKIIGKASSFIFTTQKLYQLSKKLISSGDKVLLVTNPATLIPLICGLKKRRNLELNILVHDVFPENTKAAGLSLPFFNRIKKFYDKAYSNADKLIVLGRDMAEVMREKTNGKVPLDIIENWGDFKNIIPIPMPKKDKIILEYAGNIGRVQGLEPFLQILPDEIDFHIYGSGAVEDKLKSLNKLNVFFHGPYSRSEQSEILGACHISLVTLNENMYGLGTPSKTYNILASGRPILYIGPSGTEIDLLIKEYEIGYSGIPEKWDFDEIRNMGKKAREIGERLFAKERILDKFVSSI